MVSLEEIQIVLASFGAIIGILSLLVLHKLHGESGVAMVRLQLMPEKTIRDFQLFTAGSAIMFLGYLIYFAGIFMSKPFYYDIARYIGMVYGVFVTTVVFRWWRRL